MITLIAAAVSGAFALFVGFYIVALRRVVSTNQVHIVQYSGKTVSYGKDSPEGNVYYEWPSFLPFLGVSKIVLPVSVFDLDLPNYEAYDEGRLPFAVHIKAFFRISDSNMAAQRVASFAELNEQLEAIVQGAVRSVLASNSIEEIMHGRSKFGTQFTTEVKEQLVHWGVEAVKNIELMDIRDTEDSQVIHNIMSKRKSEIEKESRIEIAKNNKLAQMAEIEATREVHIQKQQAEQAVGLRTVENKRQVNLAEQEASQVMRDAEKITKEKEMAVLSVVETRKAEIARASAVIRAEQDKQATVIAAEGRLSSTKLEAQGVQVAGEARAGAEKALLLAPVEAQTTLAKEIGENQGYQSYLVTLEKVKAAKEIGVAQAGALNKADVKVIVNAGSPSEGITKVMDIFGSKGGTEIAATLEGLSNTPMGKAVLEKLGVGAGAGAGAGAGHKA